MNKVSAHSVFNVIDDFDQEALGTDVDFSLPSERVMGPLDQIIFWRGRPDVIRCDIGPEYIGAALQDWAGRRRIKIDYIERRNPQQSTYVKRFNRTVLCEWLSQYRFDTVDEVQDFATKW